MLERVRGRIAMRMPLLRGAVFGGPPCVRARPTAASCRPPMGALNPVSSSGRVGRRGRRPWRACARPEKRIRREAPYYWGRNNLGRNNIGRNNPTISSPKLSPGAAGRGPGGAGDRGRLQGHGGGDHGGVWLRKGVWEEGARGGKEEAESFNDCEVLQLAARPSPFLLYSSTSDFATKASAFASRPTVTEVRITEVRKEGVFFLGVWGGGRGSSC